EHPRLLADISKGDSSFYPNRISPVEILPKCGQFIPAPIAKLGHIFPSRQLVHGNEDKNTCHDHTSRACLRSSQSSMTRVTARIVRLLIAATSGSPVILPMRSFSASKFCNTISWGPFNHGWKLRHV